jgi:hypothetical protein
MTGKTVLAATISLMIAALLPAAPREDREPRVVARTGEVSRDFGTVRVPVEIDLSSVRRDGGDATLGAYVARVEFDREALVFVRAIGGSAPEFSADPTCTFPQKANSEGVTRIVASQINPYGPTGRVHVATLEFRELKHGAASFVRVVVESAAASLAPQGSTDLALPVGGGPASDQ